LANSKKSKTQIIVGTRNEEITAKRLWIFFRLTPYIELHEAVYRPFY